MQALKNAENRHSKRQETGSEGHFSAIYVIILLLPTPPWICPLHPIPPDIQPLLPTSSVQSPPLFGIGPIMMMVAVIVPTPPSSASTYKGDSGNMSGREGGGYLITLMNPVRDMESSP